MEGGWLCLSLLDVSIGCVSYSFQNVSFFNYSFWPCDDGLLTFPCLWEISFSGQMISGTVIWLLGLDRIFKVDSLSFSGGLF